MRRPVKYFIVAATVGSLSAGGIAYASWTMPIQTVKTKVVAATMPAGVTPSAALQDGRAVVSWSAQELRADLRMQRYTVTAHSVDGTHRPDVAHTVNDTGARTESAVFTAAELGGGKWKWAITPRFESWAGAEGHLSEKITIPSRPEAVAVPARTTLPSRPAPAAATVVASPTPADPPSPTPADTPSPVESTSAPVELSPAVTTEPPAPGVSGSAGV